MVAGAASRGKPMKILRVVVVASLAALFALATPAAPPEDWGPDRVSGHGGKRKLACKRCHADEDPRSLDAESSLARVDAQCVQCHGSFKDVAKQAAPRLKNRHVSAHDSHLTDVACVTCHREHGPSESFCLACHAFDMPMPGGGKPAAK